MKKKNRIDILLIARPDHSYNIYNALWESGLRYVYMVFKLLPRWLNFLYKYRLRPLKGNYSICWSVTIINTLHYNLGMSFLAKIPESFFYEAHIKRFLKTNVPRIVHYWPEYCSDLIRDYKSAHPDVATIAEIVFLNEQYVLDKVGSYFENLGLASNLDYIRKNVAIIQQVMEYENDFIVPSNLAAESFKKYYPNKNFHVIPYGITVSKDYSKKEPRSSSKQIKKFVYAGTVSIEKGCDLICECFCDFPDKELHLYGHIHPNEISFFKRYRNVKNIVFHGLVPKKELQSQLHYYDAGIHLSRFDSYSLAVSEIIGCGIPVIVSDQTGICMDVERYSFGLVTVLEMNEIRSAIENLCCPDSYNTFVSAIDNYVNANHLSYGERVVNLYKNKLQIDI